MEHGITWLLLTFYWHLYWVSTKNPFSVHQENPNRTFLFPISNTSQSILNLAKTKEESITLNEVFITRFPHNELPSSCLTFTFLALFYIPNLSTRHFPTSEALAPMFTTASTSSPTKRNFTVKRELSSKYVWRLLMYSFFVSQILFWTELPDFEVSPIELPLLLDWFLVCTA